jgi:hypothetical protein
MGFGLTKAATGAQTCYDDRLMLINFVNIISGIINTIHSIRCTPWNKTTTFFAVAGNSSSILLLAYTLLSPFLVFLISVRQINAFLMLVSREVGGGAIANDIKTE